MSRQVRMSTWDDCNDLAVRRQTRRMLRTHTAQFWTRHRRAQYCAVRARYEQSTCSPDEIALRIRTLFSDRLAAKSACSAVRNSGSGGRSFRPKAPQEAALRIPFSRAADGGVPAQFFVCRNSFLDCAFRDGAIRKACHLVPFSAISKYAVFSEPTRSGRCHSFQNSPAMLLVRFDRSIRDRRVLT